MDRDGVVTKATHLVTKPDEVILEDGAVEAIKTFNVLGLKVVIVTNQPQVARGLCTENDVRKINSSLIEKLSKSGAIVDGVYFCPHHPEQRDDIPDWAKKYRIECECRKPKPGMIIEAAKTYGIDLKKSFVVGDRTVDVLAGKNAGCKTILVKTGLAGKDNKYNVSADYECNDLTDAAKLIRRNIEVMGLILAGGRGERLMPITKNIPKPMIEVAGKPLMEHQIDLLKKHGITNIVICGSYLVEKIKDYFGSGEMFGVNITYPEEKVQLGTGGAIKNAAQYLKDAKSVVVLNGDVATNLDISMLLDFHESRNGIATLVVRESDHPMDSDVVELGENCKIVKYIGRGQKEKITANTGLMVLSSSILDTIQEGPSNIEKDVIFKAISSKDVYGFLSSSYIKDMGTFERLSAVRREFPLVS